MKAPIESAIQRNALINIWILYQDPEDIQTLGQYLTNVRLNFTHPSFLHQAKFTVNGALKGSYCTAALGKTHADS